MYLNDIHYVHVEVLHCKGVALGDAQDVVVSVLHQQVTLSLVVPLALEGSGNTGQRSSRASTPKVYLHFFLLCSLPSSTRASNGVPLLSSLDQLAEGFSRVVARDLVDLGLLGEQGHSYT